MTKLERKVAQWLLNRIVRQGPHESNTTELFGMLRAKWQRTFYEDNVGTRNADLSKMFFATERKTDA